MTGFFLFGAGEWTVGQEALFQPAATGGLPYISAFLGYNGGGVKKL
ncbi:hypothetical protein B2K_38385 [Paenibacillus mucilaginosus K02]|uniref:Uncharacterized protein n=1 Tax=Paenibacillus mucilaginosus K02 TaxID=997761 RepID=R9UMU1_9BACL|nr:hypothetical protein B2K_38385 [Paenibacillus mucilaginosus K02]